MAFCDDILGANSPKVQADEDGDCQRQKYFLTEKREKQIISLCEEMSSLNKIKARKLVQIAGIIISHIASLGPIARIVLEVCIIDYKRDSYSLNIIPLQSHIIEKLLSIRTHARKLASE